MKETVAIKLVIAGFIYFAPQIIFADYSTNNSITGLGNFSHKIFPAVAYSFIIPLS